MRILILFFLLFIVSNMFSQKLSKHDGLDFRLQVKTIDDFIDRFNYEKILEFKDLAKIDSNFYLPRESLLATLVLDSLTNNNKEVVDSLINTIINKGIYIDFYDKNWFALAKFKLKHKDSISHRDVLLKISVIDSIAYWAITGIENFLDLDSKEIKNYIPPTNNEVYFSNIPVLIENNEVDELFVRNNYNKLSEFKNLLKNKEVVFDYCSSIDYYFFQIPNFIIVVSYISFDNEIKGWLIKDIINLNNEQKSNFLKDELNLILFYE